MLKKYNSSRKFLFFYCTLGKLTADSHYSQSRINNEHLSPLFQDEIPVIRVNSESLATKYHILKGKIRTLEESIKCWVCTERKRNVVFLCGHGACQDCADQLETCHICRKKITKKIQMF